MTRTSAALAMLFIVLCAAMIRLCIMYLQQEFV